MNTAFVFFSGIACGLLLLAAAKLAISYRNHAAGRWLLVLLTGVFFYLLRPLLPEQGVFGGLMILLPIAVIPGAFWLFTHCLCNDCREFPRWGWVLIGADIVLHLAAYQLAAQNAPGRQNWPHLLGQPMAIALLCAGLVTLLRQYQSDLVESRRTLRLCLLIAIGAYMLVVVCAEFLFTYRAIPAGIPALHALLASGLAFGACLWLLGITPQALEESLPRDEAVALPVTTEVAPPLEEHQRRLLEKLQRHMQAGGYRHTGLTIRELAEQLNAREYILRSLINRHLGYRNFNEFLNRYRIDEASARLANPDQAHLPVLSIALDIGYRSLSPFNAAFKQRHKLTPTEFRKLQLEG